MSKRKAWQIPIIKTEGDLDIHRKVSWLELFFDLFFVVAVASVSHNLAKDISLNGVINFVLSFIPIWWVWIGATYYNERFETYGIENRIFTFLLMIPIAGLAIFSENFFSYNFEKYAISYLLARLIIIFLWARAGYHNLGFRKTSYYYIIGFLLGLIFLITSIFLKDEFRFIMFGIALFVEMYTPILTTKLMKSLPNFTRSKLPERFGLFIIIVLGEMIVGTITGLKEAGYYNIKELISGILCIAIGFGFWWIYFDFVGRRVFKKNIYSVLFWSYLHLPLVLGITCLGAGLSSTIEHKDEILIHNHQLISLGAAFVFLILGLLEFTLEKTKNEPTHPLISPLIKIISAMILTLNGFLINENLSVNSLLFIVFIVQLISMFYGLYVWFNQNIDDTSFSEYH